MNFATRFYDWAIGELSKPPTNAAMWPPHRPHPTPMRKRHGIRPWRPATVRAAARRLRKGQL